MDYKRIGFKAGLEIHQQLDTHKLFCHCQSVITEDIDYSFERLLRPTQSEMGDVDRAALEEAKKKKRFLYTASDESTCLVEADEEPPHNANDEAIDLCLTMASLMNATAVDEIHFMRKIVIDGSNTSGFQRTALIATEGRIDNVSIQTIALEEDAARKLEERGKLVNYGLDRLGIPLIEIATGADITSPQHAREVAERIGLLLRATGKVKRGLGTIRQDINVSVSGGSRVEIKGVQSLSSITNVAENEAKRQLGLIALADTLKKRVKPEDLAIMSIQDVTSLLNQFNSKIVTTLLKEGCAKACVLPGFQGLLKQSDTRLGKECAVYATMASGIGGIIHSDELPGYGITAQQVSQIHKKLQTKEHDAFVIALGKESVVDNALTAVIERARRAFTGVLDEVRRVMPDDRTEYMRPLPGAARMYPETDVQPVRITYARLTTIKNHLPERPEEKHQRFMKTYHLNDEQTKQLLASGYEEDFEHLVKKFPQQKNTIIRTYLNTFAELEKEQVILNHLTEHHLVEVLTGLSKGSYAKEAIPAILTYLAAHPHETIKDAVTACGIDKTAIEDVEALIQKIVSQRRDFVKEKGMHATGPLMGIVMKELRGKVDGKTISDILKKEINKIL